jgi:nitroreductase
LLVTGNLINLQERTIKKDGLIMETDFLKIIETRRSCRKYKKEQVKDSELKAVLEAGTYAPTSRGMQSPYIVAVQNEAVLRKLAGMNAKVMGSTSNPYYDAPTYVLVFASLDSHNPVQDGSCVLENMMLAAHAIGLASCWIHREREMFETPEGKELIREWGLPENIIGVGALALGYADGDLPKPKPRKEGYYRIVK